MIDPKDARIASLEAENAALRAALAEAEERLRYYHPLDTWEAECADCAALAAIREVKP